MPDNRDDDFDTANPFRTLDKRAFRDARNAGQTAKPAGKGTRQADGKAKSQGNRQGATPGHAAGNTHDEGLSPEDAESFMMAMGAVQKLPAAKAAKPSGKPRGKELAQSAPSSAPSVPPAIPADAKGGAGTARPSARGDAPLATGGQPTERPAVRAAERDKLAANTTARMDADAARGGFSLLEQPGFRKLLDREPEPQANAPEQPATTGHPTPAVSVTTPERRNTVRQRSREAVAGHGHTPAPLAGEEDNLFSRAMQGIRPLAGKGREVPPETAPRETPDVAVGHPLQDFMDGMVEFALEYTDEYLEGHVVGLDALTIGKLRAGQYSPEGHLDLHGLNALQAYEALLGFVRGAYHKGMRTVLLIPGRGRNSPDGMGVLREKLQAWLTHDPFKRVVLAFCTAQPAHGGAGALYVLLRKYKKSRGKIQWDRTPSDADLFL